MRETRRDMYFTSRGGCGDLVVKLASFGLVGLETRAGTETIIYRGTTLGNPSDKIVGSPHTVVEHRIVPHLWGKWRGK